MPWSKINDYMKLLDSSHICPGKRKEAVDDEL